MRCLVTGAAGFVGSTLSERLIADGHEVRGVDCFTDYYARSIKEENLASLRAAAGFELREVDLSACEIAPLVDGIDLVFHQAAQAGVRASWGESFDDYTRFNVLATQRLLEAVKGSRIQKLVYASSSSIYGETSDLPMRETSRPKPFSPYGVTKLAAEHLVELYRHNFGVPTVSLRYFTVYGPRQRPDMAFHKFIRAMLASEPLKVFGDGRQTRDFTFVDDIVEANVLATKPEVSGVYNIGGGSRVTLNETLETLARIVGVSLDIARGESQAGDVHHTQADGSLARRDLGYAPSVELEEGLRRQVDAQRERGAIG